MSLFSKRSDYLAPKTAVAVATTQTFEVTREFHIERMDLRVNVTPTTTAATLAADGLFAAIKRIQVQIADGARTRNVVDATGAGLIELAYHQQGGLDALSLATIGVNSTAARQFTIPIWFAPSQLDDPNGSVLLLPAPRFNSNIIVTITMGAQSDIDTNATPTWAATAGFTLTLTIHRRQVSILNWPAFDVEIAESSTNYTANIAPADIELPVPGHFIGVLAREYTSASARGDISNGPEAHIISQLGVNLRRMRALDIQAENEFSKSSVGSANTIAGSYYFDFLSDKMGFGVGDLGSAMDTNVLSQTGARPKFTIASVTGGTGVKLNLVTHRIFGDVSPMKLGR